MSKKFFQVKRWTSAIEVAHKSAMPVKNGDGLIMDYRDVTIEGYLSTFVTKTVQDRCGDYILPGAFTDTLPAFAKNPIALIDHDNKIFSVAGQFTYLAEDKDGLKFQILLTNAPDMAGLRVRVVERVVRTTSMGGFFYYMDDGYGIYKVDLFEGSIVAVPMNPDALFNVRGLTLPEFKGLAQLAQAENAADQLRQSTIAGRIVEPEMIGKALELLDGGKAPEQEHETRPKVLSIGGLKIAKGVHIK